MPADSIKAILDRLETVESENLRLANRLQLSQVISAALFLMAFALGVYAARRDRGENPSVPINWASGKVETAKSVPDKIEAHEFVLRGKDGTIRAKLGANDDDENAAFLELYAEGGRVARFYGWGKDHSEIEFFAGKDRSIPQCAFGIDNEPGYMFRYADGKVASAMTIEGEGMQLNLRNKEGREKMVLGIKSGKPFMEAYEPKGSTQYLVK